MHNAVETNDWCQAVTCRGTAGVAGPKHAHSGGGQLGGGHLGWCLALMLLLRTELAAGVVSGIWWGSGGTQVAGVCAYTAVEV